jgi:hypothetical protein
MSEDGQRSEPGQGVREIGIYECDGGCQHEWDAQTMGEFPEMPDGCRGHAWVMKQAGPVGPMGFTPEQVPDTSGTDV